MSRQFGSLNSSFSHPSNLQRHSSQISLSDLTSSPRPSFSCNSPLMVSGDSTQTVFKTISNFHYFDIENPDDILDSKPSPTIFYQPPFQPTASQLPDKISHSPLHTLTLTLSFPQCPTINPTHPAS